MKQRNFIFVTQEEIDIKIVESIKSRELEILSYDVEQASHEENIVAIEDKLGVSAQSVPEHSYKGLQRDAMIVRALADGLDSDEIQKASDLLALESYKLNLEAVKIELSKSERHYNNLLALLPEERREAAYAAYQAKQSEEKVNRMR